GGGGFGGYWGDDGRGWGWGVGNGQRVGRYRGSRPGTVPCRGGPDGRNGRCFDRRNGRLLELPSAAAVGSILLRARRSRGRTEDRRGVAWPRGTARGGVRASIADRRGVAGGRGRAPEAGHLRCALGRGHGRRFGSAGRGADGSARCSALRGPFLAAAADRCC